MRTFKGLFLVLGVLFALAMACRTAGSDDLLDDYAGIMALVKDGNRVISGKAAADAFRVPLTCDRSSFDRTSEHSDKLGCFSCLTFDVAPVDGCNFEVKTIYLFISRGTRSEATASINRYVDAAAPRGASVDVEDVPTSSSESFAQGRVYRKNGKTYEANTQVSNVQNRWVASAVMFSY